MPRFPHKTALHASCGYCDTQVRQQAMQRKKDIDPYSEPAEKKTDRLALKKMLQNTLPTLVGHEQGLELDKPTQVTTLSIPCKALRQRTEI